MKHEPLIHTETARCSCGRMAVIYRPSGETPGAFTKRAYEVWKMHEAAPPASGPQHDLFEYRAERRVVVSDGPQTSLFG